jgi:hypothetical protein
LASVPARNQHDKPAEQPIAAANQRLTRTTDLTGIGRARLKSLSVNDPHDSLKTRLFDAPLAVDLGAQDNDVG